MSKTILFGKEAREKIISGVNQLANAVTTTLGPKGMNVGIQKFWVDPVIFHDGVSVAKEIELEDKAEDFAAQLVRQAAEKTNSVAGDGTTTSTLLTQYMVNSGMEAIDAGTNGMSLRAGMEIAKEIVIEQISKEIIPVETKEMIEQVATISSQNSEMGKIIAQAVWAVGKQGAVDVAESSKYGLEFEVKEGMEFEKGLTSPRFVNTDKGIVELEGVKILILDHAIVSAEKLMGFLAKVLDIEKQPYSILIFADNIDAHSLESLLTNKQNGSLYPLYIQSPGFSERRKEYLQDIASLTGGTVVARSLGMNLDNIGPEVLGRAEKVTANEKNTKIIGGFGDKTQIELRISQIEKQIEEAESEYEKKVHKERIAKLTSGCAVIKVGGQTEVEMRDNKERVIDAVAATKAAYSDGIVYGGGRMLWEISDYLANNIPEEIKGTEVAIGYYLVVNALMEPFHKLMSISGIKSKHDLEKGEGIDVMTGKKVNLIEVGIIEPAEVVKNTVKNSISVAGMLLTTNVIVVENQSPAERQAKLNI